MFNYDKRYINSRHQMLLEGPDGYGMQHSLERRKVRARFGWQTSVKKDRLEDTGVNGRIILKWI